MDEVKNRFFANINHELRTPLTLLIAPLERLMNRSEEVAPDQMTYLLGTMHSNSMRLLKLINDLLDLVRLNHGKNASQIWPGRLDVEDFCKGHRQFRSRRRLRQTHPP